MSKETAIVFGDDPQLIGIVTEPVERAAIGAGPALLFLNSGLIHRVGPNRLHVRLARRFAELGMLAMRFDLSGVGDSGVSRSRTSISVRRVAEVRSAMDELARLYGLDRFVLVGNCSGAAASLLAGHADPRVVGLGLVNPQGRRTLRYYLRLASSNRTSWLRLLNGRAKLPPLRLRKRRTGGPGEQEARPPDFTDRVRTVAGRGVDVLLVSSEWDPGYDYFHRVRRGRLQHPDVRDRVALEVVPGANHDFSRLDHQESLVRTLVAWAERMRAERWQDGHLPSYT